MLGLVLVIGGVVVIAWPGVTFFVIAVIWGIALLVGDIARAVSGVVLRGYGWGWLVVLGVIEAIVGIVMLAWPRQTAHVILYLIGIYAIFAGILQILLSFQLKKAPERLAAMTDGGTIDIMF